MKDSEPKDRLPVLGPRFLDPDDDLTIYARCKNWEIFSPDWDYLREFPTFELAPLCALSVGLIPQLAVPSWVFCVALPHFDGSKRDECSCPAEPDEEAENERGAAVLREFIRRVHIAPANLAPLGELPIAAGEANAERTRVRVADFAAWAKGKGWTLHPEFSTVATAKSKTAENPYISKAPPPITPVRGGGCSARRRPAAIRPDWQEWAMVDFVTAEAAAALLLNLEPRRINTWESCTFPDDATFDKLHMRLRIIEAVPWRTWSRDYSGIPLPYLATWAISKGMEIPDELRALARPLPEVAPANEPKTDTAPVVSGESAEQTGAAPSGTSVKAAPEVAQDDDAGQSDVATTVAPEKEETPADRRANHDMTTERGCRRAILEAWDRIETRYGPKADGRQVLRVLTGTKTGSEEAPQLKTIQNRLIDLRKEKLIPG